MTEAYVQKFPMMISWVEHAGLSGKSSECEIWRCLNKILEMEVDSV